MQPLDGHILARTAGMTLNSQIVVTCLDAFEQACTPRPPQAEWFSRWPHWSMKSQERNIFGSTALVIDMPNDPVLHADYTHRAALCLPVAREWPHAPVGWQVVEG